MRPSTAPAARSDERDAFDHSAEDYQRQRQATAEAMLRAQTRYYERHVLAWYALGRPRDARAAWDGVCHLRGRLASTRTAADPGASAGRGHWQEPNPDGIRTTTEDQTRSGAYHPHRR